MKRKLPGLAGSECDMPAGLYLVRVQRAQYRWHKHKPFYQLSFYILEPKPFLGGAITAQIPCSPKVLWKLAWFLRDFRYSHELLEQDEIDTRALVGLTGVIQISREIVRGTSVVNLISFAPAADWEHLAIPSTRPEVA